MGNGKWEMENGKKNKLYNLAPAQNGNLHSPNMNLPTLYNKTVDGVFNYIDSSTNNQTMEPVDLISRTYTIKISDGRIIKGVLIAIDDQSNLLVNNASESHGEHYRQLGLVSIRKNIIDKISVSKTEYNTIFC